MSFRSPPVARGRCTSFGAVVLLLVAVPTMAHADDDGVGVTTPHNAEVSAAAAGHVETTSKAPLAPTKSDSPIPSPSATAGIVAGSIGLASLGVGAILGARSLRKKDDANCPNNVCASNTDVEMLRSARSMSTESTAFFIAGGALAASGIVLYLLAPKKTEKVDMSASLRVVPAISVHGGGFSLKGSF